MGNYLSCKCELPTTRDILGAVTPSKETLKDEKEEPVVVLDTACFGGGCYWGTEKYFRTEFNKLHPNTIVNGCVGFMGPKDAAPNPTYTEVCTGESGHVEVYKFQYSGGIEMYEQIVRFFFQFHDPTTPNKQGNDKGTQYASNIIVYSEEQREMAFKVMEELQEFISSGYIKKPYVNFKIITHIKDVANCSPFYTAHEEHQKYLEMNPKGYCNHRIRIQKWPTKEIEDTKENVENGNVMETAAEASVENRM